MKGLRPSTPALFIRRTFLIACVIAVGVVRGAPAAADRTAASLATRTPWPRVLPCSTFSTVSFDVMVPSDSQNPGNTSWSLAEAAEVAWTTEAGNTLRFQVSSDGVKARAVDVSPGFPAGALARIAVLGYPHMRPDVKIRLQCAGRPATGIRWTCDYRRTACKVAVDYPDSPQWPKTLQDGDESTVRSLHDVWPRKPGRLSQVPSKVQAAARALISAAAAWLKDACKGGRCAAKLEARRVDLARFLAASSASVVQAKLTAREDCDAGGAADTYPHLDVVLQAGGQRITVGWDGTGEPMWEITLGPRGHKLACSSLVSACSIENGREDTGRIGHSFDDSANREAGFPIEYSALALRQSH